MKNKAGQAYNFLYYCFFGTALFTKRSAGKQHRVYMKRDVRTARIFETPGASCFERERMMLR